MIPQSIIHPTYGAGTVKSTRASGFELTVSFADGRVRTVRRDQVQELHDPETTTLTPPRPLEPVAHPRHRSFPKSARQMIEALRLGIVPALAVQRLTFGRDAEIQALRNWLTSDNANDNARFMVGSYGTGKTHLLNNLRTYALKEGYAVACIEMDSLEAPFSRPKRVYGQLVQNLRFWCPADQREKGFRDLIRSAMHTGLLRDHTYFAHLMENLSDENRWHWIEAREDPPRPATLDGAYRSLPGLYNYGAAANIYCYLLSTIGWICQHPRMGFKGLLLIFDESETLFGRQTVDANQKSYNFLEALVQTANNHEAFLRPPCHLDFIFSKHASDVPFLYRQPSGLKLALAFTDINRLLFSSILAQVERISLRPLDETALRGTFDAIREEYRRAYNFRTDSLPLDDIFAEISWRTDEYDTVRMKIKGYVEALDLLRLYPDRPFEEVLQ